MSVLIGDSILKRLFERYPSQFSEVSRVFCVSGQTSSELKFLLKENRNLLRNCSVVVHIGTNDFLKSIDPSVVRQSLKAILRLLRGLNCKVCIVEIIPIGRWGVSAESQRAVREFNCFIRSFVTTVNRVVDGYSAFCLSSSEVNLNLFCAFIGKWRRVDRVHPNCRGLDVLFSLLRGLT